FALAAKEAHGMRLKVQRNPQRALDGFYTGMFAEEELEGLSDASEIRELVSTITFPDTAAVLEALDALAQADMRSLLAAILTRTLIMNGELDRICLPQASRYLNEHIAGSQQIPFKNCGHVPFLSQSIQFNSELLQFARSVCEQGV
ncbi:MAG: alpha/beta hydrolase, partial [Pelobacteraceae bacterium]